MGVVSRATRGPRHDLLLLRGGVCCLGPTGDLHVARGVLFPGWLVGMWRPLSGKSLLVLRWLGRVVTCLVAVSFLTEKVTVAPRLAGPSRRAAHGAGVTPHQDRHTEVLPTKAPR